jgi:hypothetical protein
MKVDELSLKGIMQQGRSRLDVVNSHAPAAEEAVSESNQTTTAPSEGDIIPRMITPS